MDHPRVEHLLEEIHIFDTLVEMGILSSSEIQERNIKCPFHGGGNEAKPSGRCYHESDVCPAGLFHCFTCDRSWTPIQFVMEHRMISFWQAVEWLEKTFDVTPPTVEEVLEKEEPDPIEVDQKSLLGRLDYAEMLLRKSKLKIPCEKFRVFSDVCDILREKVEDNDATSSKRVLQFVDNLNRIALS